MASANGNQALAAAALPALVVAGNRHILSHAVAALRHYGYSPRDALLIISSGVTGLLEKVYDYSLNYEWGGTYCFLTHPHADRAGDAMRKKIERALHLHPIRYTCALRRLTRFLAALQAARKAPLGLLVSGYYGHPVDRTACCLIPHDEFVLVDDGNMTREVAGLRGAERAAGFRNTLLHNSTIEYSGMAGRLKLWMYRHVGGARDGGSPRITYFTHHHDLMLSGDDRLIPYAPVHVRPAAIQVRPRMVHFLGIPALHKKIMDPVHFQELLAAVAVRYRDWDFHYYAHPSEREEEFALVRRLIPHAVLHPNQAPYEQLSLEMGNVPEVIAGCYSSTIFNLVAQPGLLSRIEMLEFPLDWILLESRRQRVDQIYRNGKTHPKITFVPSDWLAQAGRRPGAAIT